jgi:hypothetical protein
MPVRLGTSVGFVLLLGVLASSGISGSAPGVASVSVQGVVGLLNTITISSFTVSSSIPCPSRLLPPWVCFTIQQNLDIITPSSYPHPAYKAQNLILIEKNVFGTSLASADFEVYDTDGHQLKCESISPTYPGESEKSFSLPQSWDLTSYLDGNGNLIMSNSLDTVGFTFQIPVGSVMGNTELILAGPGVLNVPGQATFSNPTEGNVAAMVQLSGISGWQLPDPLVRADHSVVGSKETSASLKFSVSGSSATFSAKTGGSDQGVLIFPGRPRAKITQPPQYQEQTGQITVYVQNQGYAAYWMTISLAFPDDVDSSVVQETVSDIPCSPGAQSNCLFTPESVVGAEYGTSTVKLPYVMVEVAKGPWLAGETHYLSVTVRPNHAGVFKFRIKSVVASYYVLGQVS